MRLLFLLCCTLLISLTAKAQNEPVKWTFEAEKVGTNEYEIIATADIQDGWSLYSQEMSDEDGPIPTQVMLKEDSKLKVVGKVKEQGKKKKVYDKALDIEVVKLTGKTIFKQRVKVKGQLDEVMGQIKFMTCNAVSCMPPKDLDFAVALD